MRVWTGRHTGRERERETDRRDVRVCVCVGGGERIKGRRRTGTEGGQEQKEGQIERQTHGERDSGRGVRI